VSLDGSLAHGPEILDRAVAAGVRRITHLGHNDYSRPDGDPLETPHRAFHRAIETSGVEWTHIFPGEFMANTWEWVPSIRAESVVRAPFAAWNSAMVHEDDVAAVAMTALLEDGHAGRAYEPTGPEPVRRVDAVALIGAAIGREVRFVELTPQQAREAWQDVYDEQVVEWFLLMGEHPDANAYVSPDVPQVTGRPGLTFARWALDHADDFR
jgi:uncharacterized protein YbjT (DUF2867 family)